MFLVLIFKNILTSIQSRLKPTLQFERFCHGDFSLEDEPRCGHPTEIDLSELKDVIESDPALTSRDVASKLGCTHRAILYQFKQLRLASKLGQWVPHAIIPDQKKNRVDYCQLLFSLHRAHDWLRNLITGDEKWCLYVNFKRRPQSLKRGQAP